MVTKPQNGAYGTAWTIIVDELADEGIAHLDRKRIADRIVSALDECTPRLILRDCEIGVKDQVVR